MALADNHKVWHAFSGGEISEELFGRTELAEYDIALATCKNFIVMPHGPVLSRAGTQYVNNSKNNGVARFIPFVRGTGQSMILEFGEGYVRFHRDGGTVLSGAGEQDVVSIELDPRPVHTFTVTAHGYSNGDEVVLYGVTRNAKPIVTDDTYTVLAATTNTFQLLTSSGQRIFIDDQDYQYNNTYAGGIVNAADSAVYEIVTPYELSDLFHLKYEQSADTITISHPDWRSRELVRSADNAWSISIVVHETKMAPVASAPSVAATGTGGSDLTYRYVVTAVDSRGEESVASDIAGVVNDLSLAGQFNTITWTAVTGARYYNVYKEFAQSGRYFLINSTTDPVSGTVDDNIIPDFTKSPPEATDPFGTSDGASTLPSVVSYFEQRRIFASTLGDPQRFWATKSGSHYNMNVSPVPQDDDPFNYRLDSSEAHTIRHIIPFAELLMLTGRGLWRLFPDSGGVLTPTNIVGKNNVAVGASETRPATFRNYLLYASARGEHLQSVKFSTEASGYEIDDLSQIAAHLIDGMTWVQMGFQEAPYPIWWGLRSDGKLIGLTYSPKQNILAWHQHEFGGANAFVESMAVIPSNDTPSDLVYVLVRRRVNGATVRHIEFIRPRLFPSLAESFCVDAGLEYYGSMVGSVSGYDHLEGENVSILADGMPYTGVVFQGDIHLPTGVTASRIVAGLPYELLIKTTPLSYPIAAMGIEQRELISNVRLRVKNSSINGLAAGPDEDNLREFSSELWETTSVKNGIIEVAGDFSWSEDSAVVVQQTLPLPVTITAMAIDFAEGN